MDALWKGLGNPQKVSVNIVREKWVQVHTIDHKNIIEIHVPRAPRKHQPVYINGNPLTGTYRRLADADQRLTETEVKRMLAEQHEASQDERILKGFSLDDLHEESLQAFRNMLSAHKPDHPWLALDHQKFLQNIGGWRHDRETGEQGLTIAGLLMFSTSPVINEVLSLYFLDYQEHDDNNETRWIDRLVPDGTWSGNLFDFYRKVIRKLEADLKVPFAVHNHQRQDDSFYHQAIREAFINSIVQ